MLFYNLIGPLSRTKFIVFHQNLLFLILPFPSLVVFVPHVLRSSQSLLPHPQLTLSPKGWVRAHSSHPHCWKCLAGSGSGPGCTLWQNLPPISLWLSVTSTLVYSPPPHSPCFSFLQILAHAGSTQILGCPFSPPYLLQPHPVLPEPPSPPPTVIHLLSSWESVKLLAGHFFSLLQMQ